MEEIITQYINRGCAREKPELYFIKLYPLYLQDKRETYLPEIDNALKKIDPNNKQVKSTLYLLRAAANGELGNIADMDSDLTKVSSFVGNGEEFGAAAGIAHAIWGKKETAIEHFSLEVATSSDKEDALLAKSALEIAINRLDQAELNLLDLNEKNARWLLAFLNHKRGIPLEVKKYAIQSYNLDTTNIAANFWCGLAGYGTKYFKKVVYLANKKINENPFAYEYQFLKASAWYFMGKFETAKQEFALVKKCRPVATFIEDEDVMLMYYADFFKLPTEKDLSQKHAPKGYDPYHNDLLAAYKRLMGEKTEPKQDPVIPPAPAPVVVVPKPIIQWVQPSTTSVKSIDKEYPLKVCIKGKDINNVALTQNGGAIDTRDIGISLTNCDKSINKSVNLRQGINEFVVTATNLGGTTISETVRIQYGNILPEQKEKRIALVIGNSKYKMKELVLANPVNDLKTMKILLESLGFEVDTALDLNKQQMEARINRFLSKAKIEKYDVTCLFFAGHGTEGYLLPTDVYVTNDTIVNNTISIDDIEKGLNQDGAPVNLMFLDCCRSLIKSRSVFKPSGSSFILDQSASSRGLTNANRNAKGTLTQYSTSRGQLAKDGYQNARNSPYVIALNQHLPTPGISIYEVLAEVNRTVFKLTNEQQPEIRHTLSGLFYLNKK